VKPGDLIEWVYTSDQAPVVPEEHLWSSSLDRWVPIWGVALLVGNADGILTWVSDKGLFHARADDARQRRMGQPRVVPRAVGDA
jgi:hypothetical protein